MFFDALSSLNITQVLSDYLLLVCNSVRRQFTSASAAFSSSSLSSLPAAPPPAASQAAAGHTHDTVGDSVAESGTYELQLLTAGWCFLCETLQLAKFALGTSAQWFDFTDFQLFLLQLFSSVLLALLVLIALSWRKYGNRITNRFIRPSTAKEIEELKLSVARLNLPKEHTPRI